MVQVVEPEQKRATDELNARRQQVFESLIEQVKPGLGPVLVNKGEVPFRVRPPQADDEDDPFGLWDKSEPVVPKGKFKDPMSLGKWQGSK